MLLKYYVLLIKTIFVVITNRYQPVFLSYTYALNLISNITPGTRNFIGNEKSNSFRGYCALSIFTS